MSIHLILCYINGTGTFKWFFFQNTHKLLNFFPVFLSRPTFPRDPREKRVARQRKGRIGRTLETDAFR